jgi:hypothetical protein
MIRSFALLPESPTLTAPPTNRVCANTPQSFYDTLDLGEVKDFVDPKRGFSFIFLTGGLGIGYDGPKIDSFGRNAAWSNWKQNFLTYCYK